MEMTTDTLQGLERIDNGTAITNPGWCAAFKAQLTKDLLDEVIVYAKRRAVWVQRATGTDDPQLAETLLQDALGDTVLGEVTWDPQNAPLVLHLKGIIRGKTSHMMQHAARFQSVRITAPNIQLEQEVSDAIEAERNTNGESDLTTYVDHTITALSNLADGDADVLALLGAFGQGAIERRDVLRVTELTRTTYHNAMKRLFRLVGQLPAELRNSAIAAMA
jgi:hypothetical protein